MGEKPDYINPIKITIPVDMYNFFKQDTEFFEVYKNSKEKFHISHVLNLIIAGYFDRYYEMISGQYRRMQLLLGSYIGDSQELDKAIKQLIQDEAQNDIPDLKRGKTRLAHIRPTYKTDSFFPLIDKSMQETNETQAAYYRRMFYCYTKLPMYEREIILRYKEVSILEEACKEHKEVVFSIRNKRESSHYVIPYKLVHSLDERHNYLIGQEYDKHNGKSMAVSYKLSSIIKLKDQYTRKQIDPNVFHFLEKMEKYGPQHSINENIETCIQLNEAGRISFRSIYNDRPIYDHMDGPNSNGISTYYFTCSQDQLYLYFRRFNSGEVNILKPEKLKQRLLSFHSEHIKDLEKANTFSD